MKIAFIADIHSNHLALAAVLQDIGRLGADRIVQLGDAINGPLDPCATLRIVRESGMAGIRGNGERMVVDSALSNPSKSVRFTRECLSKSELEFAGRWPSTLSEDGWLACHGSPRSDTEYLLEDVSAGGIALRRPEKVLEILGTGGSSLILCGHTHVPRVVSLPNGGLVVNPGSVGLPAYSDDQPVFHRMETGSPHARYAVVEGIPGRWSASLRVVPYDWDQAADIAVRNGFPDWAVSLRTGFA
jgi:predicted phosphodiesterase